MTDSIFHKWGPGPLSNKQLRELISEEIITGINADSEGIGYSSFDLHITDKGYELEGCVKPFTDSYKAHVLRKHSKELDVPNDGLELKRNKAYIFELAENIKCPRDDYVENNLYGVATGRSSIGRVDVLVRLITDGTTKYDYFHAKQASGTLFLEIIPITFDVIVKPGIALSQLRLFWGKPEISLINPEEARFRRFLNVHGSDSLEYITELTVNLKPSKSKSSDKKAIALKAVADSNKPIPLWLENNDPTLALDPGNYWEPIAPVSGPKFGKGNSIKLVKNSFYILRSRELICLPPNVAVYCRAMDEALGEMRIHYAGFVHPYFGYKRGDGSEGTNIIFEVRGHNMDIFLTHGETLAKLEYYRMSEEAERIGDDPYGEQELMLSKIFKDW